MTWKRWTVEADVYRITLDDNGTEREETVPESEIGEWLEGHEGPWAVRIVQNDYNDSNECGEITFEDTYGTLRRRRVIMNNGRFHALLENPGRIQLQQMSPFEHKHLFCYPYGDLVLVEIVDYAEGGRRYMRVARRRDGQH